LAGFDEMSDYVVKQCIKYMKKLLFYVNNIYSVTVIFSEK